LGGKGEGVGKGGEMTQTFYAHMNIIKKERKKKKERPQVSLKEWKSISCQ
jgi:hypothetical protein